MLQLMETRQRFLQVVRRFICAGYDSSPVFILSSLELRGIIVILTILRLVMTLECGLPTPFIFQFSVRSSA
jgi:hypothetical protein